MLILLSFILPNKSALVNENEFLLAFYWHLDFGWYNKVKHEQSLTFVKIGGTHNGKIRTVNKWAGFTADFKVVHACNILSAVQFHLNPQDVDFFAVNLRRAGELIPVPDARLLEIYNALRPYRSTKAELYAIADELINQYGATVCGNFVKEAADIYEKRGRLKK